MFSKGKTATKVLENNAITHQYEVGRLVGSGGPEGVWKIYEGVNKSDAKVSTRPHSVPNVVIEFAI